MRSLSRQSLTRFLCLYTEYVANGYPPLSMERKTLVERARHSDDFIYLVSEAALERWLHAVTQPPAETTANALVLILGHAMCCLRDHADDREQWAFYEAFCRFVRLSPSTWEELAPYRAPRRCTEVASAPIDEREIKTILATPGVSHALRQYTTWETMSMLWGLVTIDLGLDESVCVPVLHYLSRAVQRIHTSRDPSSGILTIVSAIPFGHFDAVCITRSFVTAATSYPTLVRKWATSDGDTALGLRGTASWSLIISALRSTFPGWTHTPGPLTKEIQPLVLELIGLGSLPPDRGRRLGCLITLLSRFLRLTSRDDEATLVKAALIVNEELRRAAARAMDRARATLS